MLFLEKKDEDEKHSRIYNFFLLCLEVRGSHLLAVCGELWLGKQPAALWSVPWGDRGRSAWGIIHCFPEHVSRKPESEMELGPKLLAWKTGYRPWASRVCLKHYIKHPPCNYLKSNILLFM